MARRIKVRSIKRRELDKDKLALAFLLLAKILDDASKEVPPERDETKADAEAA